jgi:hypothetical protein
MASVSDFPQEEKPRQSNTTGNFRMPAMRELPVVSILRQSSAPLLGAEQALRVNE